MSRVFVSYSSHDRGIAQDVHRWLSAAGHMVFLDQDRRDGIGVGDDWERRLHGELRRADAVVCIITSAYVASRWCTAEVAVARSRGCRVLPVAAEPGVMHELLGSVQHTDLADARQVLPDALRRVGLAGWPDGRSPYPGLAAFDADLRPAFFGREHDLDRLLKRMRSAEQIADGSMLLVVGPSGSGKSSLVRAGLIPAITEEPDWWRLAPILPRADPMAALERELAAAASETRLGWSIADVRRELEAAGLAGVADELLLAAPGGRARRLLIVVDQFEELLNNAPPAERARLATLLAPALSGPVQVVATLRPEFLDPLLADPDLGALPTTSYLLRPLHRDTLRTVIQKPAELAGFSVTDDLVDDLVADTASGEALPLLAFTLARLAHGVVRGGSLTRERYTELGGVQGALARQADDALAEAVTVTSRDEVIGGLLDLAAVDEQGRILRRRVRREELPDLDAFVDRRLLTTNTPGAPQDPTVYVEVTHEAFLTAWQPLAEEIRARTTALRARRAVELAAEEWQRDRRAATRLWERGQLAAAVDDLGIAARRKSPAADRVRLSGTAATFLRASMRRDRIRRTRAVSILSALLAVALVAATVAVVQQRSAQHSQRVAVSRQLVIQADAVRAADPQTGLLLGVAAERVQPAARNRAALAAGMLSTRYAGTLTGHTSELIGTAARPDGKVIATVGLDGQVILWDVSAPGPPTRLAAPLTRTDDTEEELLGPATFSADGRLLAIGRSRGTVLLYDVGDPTAPRRLPGHVPAVSNDVHFVAFAPDGRTLAVAGRSDDADEAPKPDGVVGAAVALWDLTDPIRPFALGKPLHLGEFTYLTAFDRTGRWLITGSTQETSTNAVRIWDLTDRAAPVAGKSIVYGRAAAFHQAAGLLAVGSDDSFSASAFLWDLTDPGRPRQVAEASGAGSDSLTDLAFSADGTTLAVVTARNADSSVRIFDLTDRDDPRPIEEPTDFDASGPRSFSTSDETYIREEKVHGVTFLPGRPVAAIVAGDDNTLTLWDYTDPTRPRRTGQPVTGASGLSKVVAILPDGSRALTGRADGTVPVWDLTDSGAPRPAGRPITGPGNVTALAFRDDHTLFVGRRDGSATAWDLTDPDAPRPAAAPLRPAGGTGHQVAFGPRGSLVAATVEGPDTVVGGKIVNPDKVEIVGAADPNRHADISQPLFPGKGGSGGIGTMVFSPSGELLAVPVSSWGTYVTLWDVTEPARARRLGGHLEPRDIGDAVAFAPDGQVLAYTQGFGAPPAAILMDIDDPAAPRRLADPLTGHTDAVRSLAFSPDGRMLATGSTDRSVILWDVADPARPTRLGRPLTGPGDAVTHMSFAPDGRILIAAAGDGETFLWDVEDPAQPELLGLPTTAGQLSITAVALTPDGNSLAVGDTQGTVFLWDLTGLHNLIGHPTELACARTGRGLTHAEWDRYIDGLPYQTIC